MGQHASARLWPQLAEPTVTQGKHGAFPVPATRF